MKLITIGDNVVDCYLDLEKYFPGGNCVNVAVNSKRYGAEKCSYIGVFATDEKANNLKKVLEKEDINYSRSRTVVGITGQPRVALDETGDRIFVGGPKDTVQHIIKLKLTEEDYEYIRDFDLCHVSCYSSMESELQQLSKHINISFDFSDKYTVNYMEQICPYIHYGFFSGSDLTDEQIEDLINFLSPYSLEVIGITRGNKEAIFIVNGKTYYQLPKETKVVDTMGAGDSFIAGFLQEYVTNNNVENALVFATEKAAETCTFYGGFGYPFDLEE